jgi:hypothetical protein
MLFFIWKCGFSSPAAVIFVIYIFQRHTGFIKSSRAQRVFTMVNNNINTKKERRFGNDINRAKRLFHHKNSINMKTAVRKGCRFGQIHKYITSLTEERCCRIERCLPNFLMYLLHPPMETQIRLSVIISSMNTHNEC